MKALIVPFAALLTLASCATEKNSIVFSPLPQNLPTSASASLFLNNAVIEKTDYVVLREFSFEKNESIRLIDRSKETYFDISEELEGLKSQSGADAIVDLKIELKSIAHVDSNLILIERYIGFLGATLLLFGVDAIIEPEMAMHELMDMIIPGSVITAVFFGGSVAHERMGKNTYKYLISGKLVKLSI